MAFASKNAFAALGDDDADVQAPVAASAAAPAAKEAPRAPRREIPGLSNKTSAGRAAPAADADADAPSQRDGRSSRGRSERGGRGARGGRGTNRGRARHGGFDRQSGTGKEDSAKRIEQGWGGDDPKRELEAENKAVTDAQEDKPATPAEANGTPAPEPEEEKDNTKTLDEYLADLAAKRAQIGAKKEARSAETDSKALGQKVEKNQGEDYYAVQTERTTRQRERKEKARVEIEQTFNQPPVASRGGGRGGRGAGRGGDRGGRGRGGVRGERGGRGRGAPRGSAGANINLADNAAFPTLG